MKYYVEENVSQRSCTTIRHVVKMLATISETLIFFFLGVVTITTEHEWNWAYILFTLLFAFIWRGIGESFICHGGPHTAVSGLSVQCLLNSLSCRHSGADPDHQPLPYHPVHFQGPVWPRLRRPARGNLLRPGLHLAWFHQQKEPVCNCFSCHYYIHRFHPGESFQIYGGLKMICWT